MPAPERLREQQFTLAAHLTGCWSLFVWLQ